VAGRRVFLTRLAGGGDGLDISPMTGEHGLTGGDHGRLGTAKLLLALIEPVGSGGQRRGHLDRRDRDVHGFVLVTRSAQ
jgi:hypothetical protein